MCVRHARALNPMLMVLTTRFVARPQKQIRVIDLATAQGAPGIANSFGTGSAPCALPALNS